MMISFFFLGLFLVINTIFNQKRDLLLLSNKLDIQCVKYSRLIKNIPFRNKDLKFLIMYLKKVLSQLILALPGSDHT